MGFKKFLDWLVDADHNRSSELTKSNLGRNLDGLDVTIRKFVWIQLDQESGDYVVDHKYTTWGKVNGYYKYVGSDALILPPDTISISIEDISRFPITHGQHHRIIAHREGGKSNVIKHVGSLSYDLSEDVFTKY
ncbi:hypothetical protein J4459_01785 [Candidatus Woesearchaeota archaeon]|nr:hypothetical protein [Candidatus Woesearchaeota archaeon]